jgi:hypothetical protein
VRRRAGLLVAALVVALASRAGAHAGPPYAIFVDKITGPYRLSAWADPDVGVGTFYIYLQRAGPAAIPGVCRVEVLVQPADRHLPEAGYQARERKTRAEPRRFDARVKFSSQETWLVRLRIASALGNGDAETVVAATPPGQGPLIDFVLYLFPFVAVGFLFVKAALRRRSVSSSHAR